MDDARAYPAVLPVLHETEHWFVLDKPPHMHSVSQARGGARSVEAWLRARRPELVELEECGLVHRLDFETSGCLLVAKHNAARAAWMASFRSNDGRVRKEYLALVQGRRCNGSFELAFSSRHKGSQKVTVAEVRAETNPAHVGRCRWIAVQHKLGEGSAHTLLQVELDGPGRRHQIRAGLASLGMPLVGDALYCGEPHTDGLHLHASALTIDGQRVHASTLQWG